MYSESLFSCGDAALKTTTNNSFLSNPGDKFRRSISNNTHTDVLPKDGSNAGGGLYTRVDITGSGFEILDGVFGRGWNLDKTTGMITVSDTSLNRAANTDPLEKWYNLDPEPIARGQLSVVYHCEHRLTGDEFVAKFTTRSRHTKHEVAVGAMLAQCPNAVKLHDIFTTDTDIVIIMEYLPNGDLQSLLESNIVPYERDAIAFLRQMVQGLAFIHKLGIVHMDIKPENAVLKGDYPGYLVKLCDFELARIVTSTHEIREMKGTPDYVAPEILDYEPITAKTDMWSLGVVTYAILTGFLPFSGDTDRETYREISRVNYDFSEELFEDISAQAIDFIKKLLVRSPSERLSAEECLDHPWLKTDSIRPTNLSLPISVTPATPTPKSFTSPNTPTANWNVLENWDLCSNASTNNITASDQLPKTLPQAIGVTSPMIVTTPLSASPRDSYSVLPYCPYKYSPSIHSSTHSLYRENPFNDIERIRSMSKSREVLVEKLQVAKLKKNLSRSRERLIDNKLTLSTSRERLRSNRLAFHSVEDLPPFDDYSNNTKSDFGCSYKSNQSPLDVSTFKSDNYLTDPYRNLNSQDYDSASSFGAYNGSYLNGKVIENQSDQLQKSVTTDTRLSINSMTDDQYNQYLSRFYPEVEQAPEPIISPDKPKKAKTDYSNQGENQDDSYNNSIIFNTSPMRNRSSSRNRSCLQDCCNPPTKTTSNAKTNNSKNSNAAKVKVDSPTRKSRLDNEKKNCSPRTNRSPEKKKKSSVSHVEQRIQERHERMQNKIDKKQTKVQRKNATCEKPRRYSSDYDFKSMRKSDEKNHSTNATSRRNSYPKRKNSNHLKNSESCKSTTSMDDVKDKIGTTNQLRKKSYNLSSDSSLNSPVRPNNNWGSISKNNLLSVEQILDRSMENKDDDEAYVSLETVDDGIFSRSESMDSTTTVDSDNTIRGSNNSNESLDATYEKLMNMSVKENQRDQEENLDNIWMTLLTSSDMNNETNNEEIKEKSFSRSISASSDIGSMLSEASDLSIEEIQRKLSLFKESNTVLTPTILRSQSLVTPVTVNSSKNSRSTSLQMDTPLCGVARPWGEICYGSVTRAKAVFTQPTNESIGVRPIDGPDDGYRNFGNGLSSVGNKPFHESSSKLGEFPEKNLRGTVHTKPKKSSNCYSALYSPSLSFLPEPKDS